MTKPTENELFEKYMSNRGYAVSYIGDGQYEFSSTQLNWEIWQARAELANKEQAELQAKLDNDIASLQLATNRLRKTLKDCEHTLKGFSTDLWSNQLLAKVKSCLAKTRDHWKIKNDEIKEMQSKIKNLEDKNQSSINYIKQLKADNKQLRKALEKVIFHAEFREQDEDTARAVAIGQLIVIEELANEYLAKTAPQCLIEHDNEVIERCAKVCDDIGKRDQFTRITASAFAHKIRALKGSE